MTLLFLSGPQGGGKTTLVSRLKEHDASIIVPELITKTPKFSFEGQDVDFFYRLKLKHVQRSIENYECYDMSQKNPGKIVIGNRCIYDSMAYGDAYLERGWISENERREFSLLNIVNNNYLLEPYAIILNPGFEITKRHLEKRWKKHEKKFMEADMSYLECTCNAFEQFKDHPKILYIDHELNDGTEIMSVYDWVRSINETTLYQDSIEKKFV